MKISILGCGAYGLVLANSLADNDFNEVLVWSKFDREVLENREKYLRVSFTNDLESAIEGANLLIVAVPIQFLEETMINLKDFYLDSDILIASKGIDINSGKFGYEIVKEILGAEKIGVISGGTFAVDMNNKKVMGLSLATNDKGIEDKVKRSFQGSFIKIQYINDIIGVSICGAVKNVMAIGFGMLDGAMFPPSSRFLFLTEALYEISNLIKVFGGFDDTIMSYAGIGDIMMTCTSKESRNYTFGYMIGNKDNIDSINSYKKNNTIEGLGTSKAIYDILRNNKIVSPIIECIYRILYEDSDINELIELLKKEA